MSVYTYPPKCDDRGAHPDDQAVDRFAEAMKAKLKHAREVKGKSGWDTDRCSDELLADELIDHICKGNTGTFEDVANFCMMLHQREASPHELARAYHAAQSYDPNPAPGDQPTEQPSVEETARVLLETRHIVCDAAETGFNCHDGDWAERLFRNNGQITTALRALEGGA